MRCWLLVFCASLWIARLLANSLIPAITPSASQADLHNCTHLLKLRIKHPNEETSNTSLVTQTLYVSPTAILHKIRLSLRTACFSLVSGITCLLWCYLRVVGLIKNKGFAVCFTVMQDSETRVQICSTYSRKSIFVELSDVTSRPCFCDW